jgi:hypothetical protein
VTTVDEYCRVNRVKPTVIKIDVEGFEGEVLRGAEGTLRRCRPTVLCEVIYESTRALMLEFGYVERPLDGHFANSLFVPV